MITSESTSSYTAIAIVSSANESGQPHITTPIETYMSGMRSTKDKTRRITMTRMGFILSFFSDLSLASAAL